MKLFRKLAVNVQSQMEAVAHQFENKEALSSSYIREYERIVATAKVKLARVDAEAARLEKEIERLASQAALWKKRARRVHTEDKDQALECVRRMQQARNARSDIEHELEEIRELKHQMAGDVDQAGRKLDDLKRRHRILAGRQSCAEALDGLPAEQARLPQDLDALYSRWETDVVARELHTRSLAPAADRLAAAFDRQEDEAALQMTLAEIVNDPNDRKE